MDFYHDDPIEVEQPRRRNFLGIFALIVSLICGGLYIQSTLAANITLNSRAPVEFGQGFTTTAACSGSTLLRVTPQSTFTNASNGGTFYFSSVSVSNIPASCNGVDFTINAFGQSDSSPLAIFNSTSTNAVVFNNAGTFQLGSSVTGASITSSSGAFTITFSTPVAASSSVYKLTIQSSVHAEAASLIYDNTNSSPQVSINFNSGITQAELYQGVAGWTITKVIVNCVSNCSAVRADWNFYTAGPSDQPLNSLGIMTIETQTASQLTFSGSIVVPSNGKFHMGWYLYSGSFRLPMSQNPVNAVGGNWSQIAGQTDWYNFGLGTIPNSQEGQPAHVLQIFARP